MNEARCVTCTAYHISGECRFNYPHVVHGWPEVSKNDWCCKHIPKVKPRGKHNLEGERC